MMQFGFGDLIGAQAGVEEGVRELSEGNLAHADPVAQAVAMSPPGLLVVPAGAAVGGVYDPAARRRGTRYEAQ